MKLSLARTVLPLCCALTAPPAGAQAIWELQMPAARPGPRTLAGLVWDGGRGVALLYGGGGTFPTRFGDTWEWDGNAWTQRSPATSPPPLAVPGMAYDAQRDRVVLFGGLLDASTASDQTWEWDGVTWTQRTPANRPSPRGGHGMAYDAVRGRVVLFGGTDGTLAQFFGDTWEYDGVDWVQASPPNAPSGRVGTQLVYDAARGCSVLFGGALSTMAMTDETWEWDGATWTQRNPIARPEGRFLHGMTYDALRQRVVCVAGELDFIGGLAGDTWEYDGNAWVQRFPSTFSLLLSGPALCYDAARARVVLFGGCDEVTLHDETHEYFTSAPASYQPLGAGCQGTAGVPALAAAAGSLPWTGDRFTLELDNLPAAQPVSLALGLSRTRLGPAPLPFALGIIGMTGCSLYGSAELLVPLANAQGRATAALDVPDDPGLIGQMLFPQGLVLDPGANPAGATTSDAGAMTIGAR